MNKKTAFYWVHSFPYDNLTIFELGDLKHICNSILKFIFTITFKFTVICHPFLTFHVTLMDRNSSDKVGVENFVQTKNFVCRKFCPIFQYKIGQICRNFGLVSTILSDKLFCPTKILYDEILSDKVH